MSQRFPRLNLEGPSTIELSLEQRYETLENVFVHQFFQLYRVLGQRFGWDVANEIAGEVPEPAIPLIVEGYRRKFGLEGEGAALLSQVLQAEFQAEGSDVAVIHEDPAEATIDVLCTFGAMLQRGTYSDVKIEHGLCNAGCVDWVNRVGETVEPAVGAERLSWMGEGAPRCRFRLRRSDRAETS
jgi:hypothetical protein